MKNKILLLAVLLFSWTSEGIAAIVPADVAAETAEMLMGQRSGKEFKGGKAYVETVLRGDAPVYYIVRFEHGGWAMISAEDTVEPLLGYSFDSEMVSVDQMPDVMTYLLSGYADEIEFARQLTSLERHYRWNGELVTRASDERINPLIKVDWNQGSPYNAYCPGTGSNQAVVGCVAVGMGQALSVVKFPIRGQGTKSYQSENYGTLSVNFDEEPDYDWNAMLGGDMNEVARLLYHCGVLVEMGYTPNASGAQSAVVDDAFRQYYGFSDQCKSLNRSSYKDDAVWEEMMLDELRRGRAVIYSGQNSESGHCFNLDGYDGVNFHVNWGWGGMANGYFALNALDPESQGIGGSSSGYNQYQQAIIGVAPLSDTPYDLRLSTTRFMAGVPVGTAVADVTVYSDKTDAEYDFELEGPVKSFPPGTTARNESSYEVRRDDSKYKLYTVKEIADAYEHKSVKIKATHKTSGESIEKEFSLTILPGGGGIDGVLLQEFKLYPVPATHVLTVESPYENGEYVIVNVAGVAVLQGELTDTVTTLDISSLSSGSYLLRFSTEQGVVTKPFIVK